MFKRIMAFLYVLKSQWYECDLAEKVAVVIFTLTVFPLSFYWCMLKLTEKGCSANFALGNIGAGLVGVIMGLGIALVGGILGWACVRGSEKAKEYLSSPTSLNLNLNWGKWKEALVDGVKALLFVLGFMLAVGLIIVGLSYALAYITWIFVC